jgi:rhodanese-related sulfurtransferase
LTFRHRDERKPVTTSTSATISATELRDRLASDAPPHILDVRTPAEFETAHIAGAHNVPLDVVRQRRTDIVDRLGNDSSSGVVFVCRSGQRATQAEEVLRTSGLTRGAVLRGGILDWENAGNVDRGTERWELERQVRLVAGSIVLTSVLGSTALPKLKWLAAAIGGGLTFAAVSNTCAMATALSKLPYNRRGAIDAAAVVARLGEPRLPA